MAERLIYFDLVKNASKEVTNVTNDIAVVTNEQSVLESVENILTTEKGSLIYTKADFGTSLEQFLFEPIDVTTALQIFEQVELGMDQEPRAKDIIIEITPLPDEETFKIDISFFIDESDRQLQLQITLDEIR